MPPVITEKSIEINGRTLTIEHGRIAGLADGSVTIRYGDTLVLSTAVGSKEPRPGVDFLPLTVDYEERMYAAGKIPGGFIKREGRPSEKATLTARLTDRPIRPLFPDGWRSEIQLITTVMSTDQQNDPDVLSIVGASTALAISDIPWDGPIAAVRIGDIDGNLMINPTSADLENSVLNMVVAGTADAVMMVEGEANEVSEERMIEAVMAGHDEIKRIVELINELREAVGKPKRDFTPPAKNTALIEKVEKAVEGKLRDALFHPDKEQRNEATSALKAEVVEQLSTPSDGMSDEDIAALPSAREVSDVYGSIVKGMVRREILEAGDRPDGRKPDEIRDIWGEVSYLPRTHGSAIFTRGQTQVVTAATLGTSGEGQMIDGIGLEDNKRYMHHYNFPPYSVGEARFMRGPSRRDIGHGALAERALIPVLPDLDEFPYTMRLVSEVVTSNGSTSMASVCGSTMALMDAGVPIKAPVAGMAMGLITDGDSSRYQILSDIQGLEDALGDMDFKVAGTGDGVTAIQMDIKVAGITAEIMQEALDQARKGRLFILSKMNEVIDASRGSVSDFAPQITRIQIDKQQIGTLIGPGGKMIRGIQEETGAKLEVEEDGTVYVSSVDRASSEAAIARIEALTKVPEVGEVYTGKVKTIIASGAFVEILPGKDGFVHISELENRRVEKVEDVLAVGDETTVVVSAIRNDGKINLSRKRMLPAEGGADAGDAGSSGGSSSSGGNSGGGGERRGGGDRSRDRSQSSGGGDRGGNNRNEGRVEQRFEPDPSRNKDKEKDDEGGDQIMRRPRDSRTPPGRS
ncbi:MAG: polyribonucleotide nucleotidyltransferase [Sphaerobacteraceae bacterium]|nr:MAG: polyribonucleotide nucleotidyltransferase [Sphaerobacteraceae bacterium]